MGDHDQAERLIHALMEQLRMPLVQIAHHAELAREDALQEVGITAERALALVDNYRLALIMQQQELQFEPVTISSVLYDVATILEPMAKQHNCTLELRLDGRYEPVMTHRDGLKAALVTLGQGLIETESSAHPTLVLAGYKSRRGLTAGLFTHDAGHFLAELRRTRQTQSMTNASLYVADSIMQAISTKLYAAHHHKLNGLAATFAPSSQLQLV